MYSTIIWDIQPLENMNFAHCVLFDKQMFIYSYMYMSRSVQLSSVSLPSSWRAHVHKVSSIAVGKFMWPIIRNVHL